MSFIQADDIIIHGTTSNGKVFRPSDWAERLCGILSSFNKDHRLSYHEWVHPVLLDKIRCVVIDAKLQEINPSMFRFLMDFAADNDLRVLDGKTLQAEQQGGAAPLQQAVPDSKTAYASGQLREIAADNTAAAYAALSVLRPMIGSVEQFVAQVNGVQRGEGYRLIGIFEAGKNSAVAVCGFRERTNLGSGRHIHIDDLVTLPESRKRGYAGRLLDEVQRIAAEQGIGQMQVDSSVGGERANAHRVYFQHGFEIDAYHFVCPIAPQKKES